MFIIIVLKHSHTHNGVAVTKYENRWNTRPGSGSHQDNVERNGALTTSQLTLLVFVTVFLQKGKQIMENAEHYPIYVKGFSTKAC